MGGGSVEGAENMMAGDVRGLIHGQIVLDMARGALLKYDDNHHVGGEEGPHNNDSVSSIPEPHLIETVATTENQTKPATSRMQRQKNLHNILVAKEGQASLRRVLRAYIIYNKGMGYCQGMIFLQ